MIVHLITTVQIYHINCRQMRIIYANTSEYSLMYGLIDQNIVSGNFTDIHKNQYLIFKKQFINLRETGLVFFYISKPISFGYCTQSIFLPIAIGI